MGIIGGSDGPTAIFVTSNPGWFSIEGLIFVVLILIPNILYAFKFPNQENRCTNRFMNLLEQIGRYGCMALMVFRFPGAGIAAALGSALTYLIGCPVLILAYWVVWFFYFRKRTAGRALALALLPTAVFALSGVTMQHWALLAAAAAFGIGHVYVTMHNL